MLLLVNTGVIKAVVYSSHSVHKWLDSSDRFVSSDGECEGVHIEYPGLISK